MKNKRIVITGMGTVNPCGNTIQDFWNNIKNGRSGITETTKFDTTDFKCKIGGELKNFDPVNYGMSIKEAKRMDPFTQYAVAASDMAIKDAKLILDNNNERINVIFGVGIGGFKTLENAEDAFLNHDIVSPLTIPMLMPNAASAEVSIRYKIKGANFTINAACASSGYAITQSIMRIQVGVADVIITGGPEAAIAPLSYMAFTNMKALINNGNEFPEKACRPFDAKRSGFIMAEGAAVLILESLDHALQRGAPIYAEIIGFGESSDAYHITAPGGDGAYNAMQYALHSADIEPYHVDYINAHGTSTELNDKMESQAIERIFGNNIAVSSTKSMTGHLLGAAAALETIVCVKSIQEGVIPPTINYEYPDPECGNLDYGTNKAKKTNVNIAMNNSFGFGGHNACIILRKYM